jgi:two-component system LytT family sensor kinase
MKNRKLALQYILYTQLVFWVVLFIFLLLSALGTNPLSGLGVALLLLTCHLLTFYTVYGWLTPRFFERGRYGYFVAGVVGLLLVLTPFRFWIETNFVPRPFLLLHGQRLHALIIFSEILLGSFAFLFRMALDSFASREQTAEMEITQLQTELRLLKSQMNPHFLFNTINNVYSLALTHSEKTPHALLTLSKLLQYLLYECNTPVPLHKEMQAIESYITLLQLRYENPLNIKIENQIRSADRPIEPMLLIPLLENAFKHSGIGILPEAFIRIQLHEEEGLLVGHFINSRSSLPADVNAGGIGLQNIRKRLGMLQPRRPEENLVVLESPEVFEVFIRIPR